MSMRETWINAQAAAVDTYDHARLGVGSMYNIYRDGDNPGAEIRVSAGAAWRVHPDGREEDLSPEDVQAWIRRLRTDSRRAARNRRRGEI